MVSYYCCGSITERRRYQRQVQRLYLEDLRLLTELSPNLAMLRLLFLPEEEVGTAARSILDNPPTEEEFQRRLDLALSYTSE
jgi:predicted transposase YdaD